MKRLYHRLTHIVSFDWKIEIDINDLDDEIVKQIKDYTKDCTNQFEKYSKLNGIFTEVIAWITKQAEPLILDKSICEDIVLFKRSFYEIRELVSSQWRLIK